MPMLRLALPALYWALLGPAALAFANNATPGNAGNAGGAAIVQTSATESLDMHVHTLKEMKLMQAFRRTWHQQYDFSCGSAALATLLTFQYDHPIDETTVFKAMFSAGDQAQIRSKGFSLLDMKRFLEANGYQADGVRAPLDKVAQVGIPAIALISDHGYRDFVVVKGVDKRHVVIGDPALGTRILERSDFERSRVGDLFFVIRNHREWAHFNLPADWNFRLGASPALAVDRSMLGTELLTLPEATRF
jgi:predicted double-glycine peptidase